MKKTYFLLLIALSLLITWPIAGQTASSRTEGATSKEQATKALFRTITPQEARQLIENRQDLLLVDVRSPAELKEGAIEGSTLIPLMDIVQGKKNIPKDHPVLLICAVGGRSLLLGKTMSKFGWQEVYNLKGGISAWKDAGLPVVY